MNESKNSAEQNDVVQGGHTDPATIDSLIANLASKDGMVRVRARRSLVAIGEPAVRPLVEALASRKQWCAGR